ncbi:MAG: GTP 3',8-cyclase MoaA [Phycisphaerales bacterium]
MRTAARDPGSIDVRARPARGADVSLPQFDGRSQREIGGVPPVSPTDVRAGGRMIDSHGRTIRDLRISITDRCNFRCVYCMEPDVRFAPRESLLTVAEIVRVAAIAESLGVRKVRLTGGEPTLHPDLTSIIAGIRRTTSVEIAMITNASLLTRAALREWKAAGLDRVTISIDSLRPDRFARLTRSTTSPADVVAGVKAVIAEGLTPLKLNGVLIRGFNDDEAADMAALARRFGVEMRFIEYMPLDSGHAWDSSRWVSAAETRAAIEERHPLVACEDGDPSSTARTFAFADGAPGRVGFIAPISSPFCGACSRLRLTADGKVRPCLFSTTEWDLRAALRAGSTDEEVAHFLIDATWTKQPGHGIASPGFRQPERPMSAIGG